MPSLHRRSTANPLAYLFDLDAREEAPVSVFCNAVLREALKAGSRHLQLIRESETTSAVNFERAGTWERMIDGPGVWHNALVSRLKIMGSLRIDRREFQQGQIYALFRGREIAIKIEVRRLANGTEAVHLELPLAEALAR